MGGKLTYFGTAGMSKYALFKVLCLSNEKCICSNEGCLVETCWLLHYCHQSEISRQATLSSMHIPLALTHMLGESADFLCVSRTAAVEVQVCVCVWSKAGMVDSLGAGAWRCSVDWVRKACMIRTACMVNLCVLPACAGHGDQNSPPCGCRLVGPITSMDAWQEDRADNIERGSRCAGPGAHT